MGVTLREGGQLRSVHDGAARASRAAVSEPASTHRRTVSSLTPRRPAASLMRNCVMSDTLVPHLRNASRDPDADAGRP